MTNSFQESFHAAFNAPRDLLTAFIEQEMGAQVTGLERVTHGYVNEVYRADFATVPTVFIRVRRRGGVSFASEAWALEAGQSAGVPVPVVYAVTTLSGDEPLEVMLLSLVPGRPLGNLWPELDEAERSRAMGHVGGALRSLHSVEVDGWGRRTDDGSWEFTAWKERAGGVVRDRAADVPVLLGAGFTEAETDALTAILRVMPTLSAPRAVLCHGDLGMDHLFVDDALELTGVIDFGAWRGGPRELDFAVLTMYHPDVRLEWLEQTHQRVPFDRKFYRRVLIERVDVQMGFLAHDLRQGNADYLELARLGIRGTLEAWEALA